MIGAYAYTPAIWPPLLITILLLAMDMSAWQHRDMPAVKPFAATVLFGALVLAGIAFETAAVTPAAKIAWNQFQFLFTLLAVTAGTCFYLEYPK